MELLVCSIIRYGSSFVSPKHPIILNSKITVTFYEYSRLTWQMKHVLDSDPSVKFVLICFCFLFCLFCFVLFCFALFCFGFLFFACFCFVIVFYSVLFCFLIFLFIIKLTYQRTWRRLFQKRTVRTKLEYLCFY